MGVFKGKKDSEEPLHTEKVWITQPRTTFTFVVNEPPTRAATDPYSKLIDRNPEDGRTLSKSRGFQGRAQTSSQFYLPASQKSYEL